MTKQGTATNTAAEPGGLAPVRAALLARARAAAARLRADATAERDRKVAAARQEADGIRAQAQHEGRAAADTVGAAEIAAAGRAARQTVLRARRQAYEQLSDDVRARVTRWLADPPVQALCRSRIGAVLGPDAVIVPLPDSGMAGTVRGRRVEITAQALTDHAVRGLGTSVEELWGA